MAKTSQRCSTIYVMWEYDTRDLPVECRGIVWTVRIWFYQLGWANVDRNYTSRRSAIKAAERYRDRIRGAAIVKVEDKPNVRE